MRQIIFTIAIIVSVVAAVDGRAADTEAVVEFVPGELLVRLETPSESESRFLTRTMLGSIVSEKIL